MCSAHSYRVETWLGKETSPIESIMGMALSIIHTVALDVYNDLNRMVYLVGGDSETDAYLWRIQRQAKIGKYKADFAVQCILCPGKTLIVECDGHDFHEKTKQQAAHDKKRDRFMTVSGYGVLRFTGSEIYRDPIGCVREVVGYFAQFPGHNKLPEAAHEYWMGR